VRASDRRCSDRYTPLTPRCSAGRYLPEYHEAKGGRDFFECCRDPEVASTLTLQPIERYAGLLDASIIFSDILVIPQAMGMTVEMVDKKGPHFPNPLRTPTDGQYAEVMQRDVDVAKELDYVYKAITLTRKKLQGRVPLFGFCGAPWTLFCYMVEGGGSKIFKEVKTWIYTYPEETKALLQKIAELCVEYLALQVKAGAQVLLPLAPAQPLSQLLTDRPLSSSKSSTRGPASCRPRRSRSSLSPTWLTLPSISRRGSRRWAWNPFPWSSSPRAHGTPWTLRVIWATTLSASIGFMIPPRL
jgi:hypothetical protein